MNKNLSTFGFESIQAIYLNVESFICQCLKKIIIFCGFLFVSLSCSNKSTTVLKFKPFKNSSKYKFEIPTGYQEIRYMGGGEYQQEYHYEDSSILYVTNFINTYNYEAIRAQGTYYHRFRAIYTGDTITLGGRNEKGLSWKDKLIEGGITIGYTNVSEYRLVEFERAVLSIKRKKSGD